MLYQVQLAGEYPTIDQPAVNNKELGALNIFWLGFIIYTGAYTLFRVPPYYIFLNAIQFIGLLLMCVASVFLIQFRIEDKYLRSIYVLYCGWLIVTVGRGFKFDFEFLYDAVVDAWFVLPFFVPIVLLFPKNIFYLKKIFKVIGILSILYVGFSIIYRKELLAPYRDGFTSQFIMEYFSKDLSIPCGFILLTYIYHSNKRKVLAFSVAALTLVLALIRARRALIFMSVSYWLFFYIIYLYINKVKFFVLLFSLLLVAVVLFLGVKFYTEKKNSTFSLITERIDEDSRTGVEDCFYNDLKTKDWIIGKGLMGEYYCPGIDENGLTDYRNIIETDYLNIILKGGIISLGLLLLITIPAIFKGLFYSKNVLSKAAGIWILLWLIDLYPATVNTFTLPYFLVWISIGICYSKTIRNMPETTIKEIFFS